MLFDSLSKLKSLFVALLVAPGDDNGEGTVGPDGMTREDVDEFVEEGINGNEGLRKSFSSNFVGGTSKSSMYRDGELLADPNSPNL